MRWMMFVYMRPAQAHFISCRSMEIFKHAFSPSLYKRIQEEVPPLRYWRWDALLPEVLSRPLHGMIHLHVSQALFLLYIRDGRGDRARGPLQPRRPVRFAVPMWRGTPVPEAPHAPVA